MYQVKMYYQLPQEDFMRHITLYGVYLNASVLEWLSKMPNFQYCLINIMEKENKE